jgi:hypothetical protein
VFESFHPKSHLTSRVGSCFTYTIDCYVGQYQTEGDVKSGPPYDNNFNCYESFRRVNNDSPGNSHQMLSYNCDVLKLV